MKNVSPSFSARLRTPTGRTSCGFSWETLFIPNSKALVERVKSSRGYDLSTCLIGLFHDIGPKTDQIRCDYYGAMSEMLEHNFYQPTSQWLESRGLQYTTIATWGRLDPLEHTYHYGDYFR